MASSTSAWTMSLASMVAMAAAVSALPASGAKCPDVKPKVGLNTTEYIRATWYIQQQQITGYQAKDDLYCVLQTFAEEGRKVPFFTGNVISVYNYAVNGSTTGTPVNTENGTVLCAREPDPSYPGKLINAPCFLPNILAGDYWAIAAGPSAGEPATTYSWAIVSGGPPTVQYSDGCTTKTTGVNGAGLWLFHRRPLGLQADIDHMRGILTSLGYTLQELLPVGQAGCSYHGAYIKK